MRRALALATLLTLGATTYAAAPADAHTMSKQRAKIMTRAAGKALAAEHHLDVTRNRATACRREHRHIVRCALELRWKDPDRSRYTCAYPVRVSYPGTTRTTNTNMLPGYCTDGNDVWQHNPG